MCLTYKIKKLRLVGSTLLINLIEVIYSQLSKSIIINILIILFIITYYTFLHLVLNCILCIFHIFFDNKLNYLVDLQNILKYSSMSTRLCIFFHLIISNFCLCLKYSG